jgi:protein-S-isoprenylcysteine O-methyltransferase Ste14
MDALGARRKLTHSLPLGPSLRMPVTGTNMVASRIIIACWITFAIYWMVSALRTKAVVERQGLLSAAAHRVPIALGWWILAYPDWLRPMSTRIIPHAQWVRLVGSAICLYGLFLTIWARRTLAGNWSSNVTFKQGHELVRTGPYRYVRHPIYTGLLIMGLGTAVEIGQLHCWLSLPITALGFWIKLAQEERLLLRHFPNEYPAYQQEVKALVPFLF